MEIKHLESFTLKGLKARTQNSKEMDAATAKIGDLWALFYQDLGPKLEDGANIYGVYTNYQSDMNGEYDIIACTNGLPNYESAELVEIKVETGKYLLFKGKGEMPEAVISVWGEIWSYFSAENCVHTRAYTTDFEYYKSDSEIEIYIAIQ